MAIVKRILYVAFCGAAALPLIFGGLWVVNSTIDAVADQRGQREVCLKRATNGYDIQRCR